MGIYQSLYTSARRHKTILVHIVHVTIHFSEYLSMCVHVYIHIYCPYIHSDIHSLSHAHTLTPYYVTVYTSTGTPFPLRLLAKAALPGTMSSCNCISEKPNVDLRPLRFMFMYREESPYVDIIVPASHCVSVLIRV